MASTHDNMITSYTIITINPSLDEQMSTISVDRSPRQTSLNMEANADDLRFVNDSAGQNNLVPVKDTERVLRLLKGKQSACYLFSVNSIFVYSNHSALSSTNLWHFPGCDRTCGLVADIRGLGVSRTDLQYICLLRHSGELFMIMTDRRAACFAFDTCTNCTVQDVVGCTR